MKSEKVLYKVSIKTINILIIYWDLLMISIQLNMMKYLTKYTIINLAIINLLNQKLNFNNHSQ